MKNNIYLISFLVYLLGVSNASSQICDPTVPVFNIDLTGSPNGTWTSPPTGRIGQCCSASGADVCVEFVITLDSAANGISFDIISGAIPGGALFYQVNCGPPSPLGAPVCLSGVGPHYITFCKPGNNVNEYQIQSIPQPSAGGTQYVSQACTGMLIAQGMDQASISYTSVPYNALYNSFLSCTSGCDTSIVTPIGAAPAYVDYQICGMTTGYCDTIPFCDTIRVNFVNTLAVNITPQNPTICFGGANAVVTANPSGGLAPYSYVWSTGATTQSISVGAGTYTVTLTDAMNCSVQYDTVTVNAFSLPISANAGPDQLLCNGAASSVALNGVITAASGGIWSNYSGTFSPDDTTMNAVYTPSASEISAGSATLMLVTTGNQGCPSDTDYISITIAPQPSPVVTGGGNVCHYSTQLYTASNATPVTYAWSVAGGTITNNLGDSISVYWSTLGAGSVTVTASNSAGCDTTNQIPVTVQPQPAPIMSGTSFACTPFTAVYHVTNSMNDAVAWVVTGGTVIGSTSADSVVIQWSNPGTGTVTVTETSSFGCDSTVSMMVDLSSTPVTSISGLQNMCGGLLATYSAAASNAVTHSWVVTGGTIMNNTGTSIDVQWTNIGTNTITLTATNADGCDTTLSYTVDVYPQPNPSITGATNVCTPAGMVYHVSNPNGNMYNWTVLGGTIIGAANTDSVSVYWSAAGSGLVSLTETNSFGCDSIIAILVDLSATPVTSISGLSTMCGAQVASYTAAASNAITHSWSVNGGTILNNNGTSIDVQWTTIGSNSVTLTATNPDGCDTTITYAVDVYPQPTPSINGASLVCTPAVSVYHAVNPTSNSYNWTVLGGTIIGASNADSVIVSWTAAGAGLVSLTEANSFGCDSAVAILVTLSATPVTSIAGSQNICGQEVMTYSAAPSNAVTYNWSVNGGTILQSNGDSITVSWTGSVTGSVALTATNAMGCDTTIIYPVNLYPKPAPVLNGPVTLCLPASSTYRVSSPGINNYSWVVTEGMILGSASADSIQVQWNNITGTGTVTVTAANAYGCDSTATMSVALSVTPSPFISGLQTNCGPTTALYTSSASTATIYNWTVNGGTIISNNGDSVLVNWTTVGNKNITLTAINPEGCDTTLNYIAAIYPQPSPSIVGPANACTPSSQLYTLSSATGTTFSWTGLGGNIIGSSTNDSVMVTWNTVGAGNIIVTETNSYGCDTTVQMVVNLMPYPSPNITGSDITCQKDTTTYSVAPVQGHTYNWSVTGGAIVSFTITNSIDVYWYNPGAGKVACNQISLEGCAAEDSQQVYVNNIPTPAITGLPVVCLNDQANYLTSQNAGSTYEWQMDGGNFNNGSTQSVASVSWTEIGYGDLMVTETDVNGCSASAQTQVFVNPLPVSSIFGNQVGCSDQWGSLYSTNPQSNVVYQWSANGGVVNGSNGQDHVNIRWNNTGITLVNLLTLNTTTGCRSTTSLQVLVDSMPAVHVTANNFTGCAPFTAALTSTPQSPSYSYQWWFGDGSSSFDAAPNHAYMLPGTYTITLVTSNNSGCKDTVQAAVVAYNSPVADFDLNVSDDFYPDDESVFSLQNNSTGGAQYLWSFGDGHTTTDFQPSYHYDGAGSYNVMLIVTNANGCRDSMMQAVEIRVPESIYIPNAFTPNGDSNNDGFSVYSQNITDFKVSIFDRWGEEIFSSRDKEFVWDGTYSGKRVQEGVYVYKIAAVGFHGQRFEKVGTVSVLK